MLPPLYDSKCPCHTLSIMHPTATCEYQIAIIESQGLNSRGVRLLRVGLARLGKTYVPQLGMTKLACPFINAECVGSNMCSLVEDSTSPCETLPHRAPTTTCRYQISLIESQGPTSRVVCLSFCMLDWLTVPRLYRSTK